MLTILLQNWFVGASHHPDHGVFFFRLLLLLLPASVENGEMKKCWAKEREEKTFHSFDGRANRREMKLMKPQVDSAPGLFTTHNNVN